MAVTTTFTATWDCTSLCKCFAFTDGVNLKVSGKLCRGGSMRLAWKGPGDNSEWQCWAPALCWGSFHSSGSKDSYPMPELQHDKHFHFGYRVLVWGCTVLLTVSHSCDRATGWVFSTLVVTNLRKPPGGAVRMGRIFSHHLLKSVTFYFDNDLDWVTSHHTESVFPFYSVSFIR